MPGKQLKIGMLGASRIGPKAVIDPARDCADADVVAVAARDPSRAADYARKHGIADVCHDYNALVASPVVDLVYNALPVNLHAEWSIAALRHGKHVLCEKPLAMNLAEADAMLAAAGQSGTRLIEAFHYRYHPMYLTMLRWLAEERIGRVVRIAAIFNAGIRNDPAEIRRRVDTGGGAMMDLGCYALRWAQDVAGAAVRHVDATALLTDAGVDESMRVSLDFDNGVSARIETSMHEDIPFKAAMNIDGSLGSIRFDNPLAPHNGGELVLTTATETRVADPERRPTYAFQLDAVVQAIRDESMTLPTEGEAIRRQQQLIDTVYAAAGLQALRTGSSAKG